MDSKKRHGKVRGVWYLPATSPAQFNIAKKVLIHCTCLVPYCMYLSETLRGECVNADRFGFRAIELGRSRYLRQVTLEAGYLPNTRYLHYPIMRVLSYACKCICLERLGCALSTEHPYLDKTQGTLPHTQASTRQSTQEACSLMAGDSD